MKDIKICQEHCTIESFFFEHEVGGGGASLNTKVKQKIFIGEIGLGDLCIIQESWYIL